MLPEGTMWLDGSLYVAAPPSIWKLTDTDGDGVADRREEWFKGETLTGCANDLHGPYLGPDGWIYWTKGAFAQQTHAAPERLAPRDARRAHLPPPAGGRGARSRDDGRHGQPRRRRVHPRGGTDPHRDVPGASAGGQAGRDRPCDLRRCLRQAAQRARRPQADRRSDAGHVSARTGRAGRPHALRIARVRQRLSRQFLRRDVQPAKGHAPRAGARAVRRSRPATKTSSWPTIATSIRPMSSRMPTAACWSSTPAPGTSSVARRRSSRSPTCSARSIEFAGPARRRRAMPEGDPRLAIDERQPSRRAARRSETRGANQGRAAVGKSR